MKQILAGQSDSAALWADNPIKPRPVRRIQAQSQVKDRTGKEFLRMKKLILLSLALAAATTVAVARARTRRLAQAPVNR
jgi:hypothetical protein